MTMLVKIKSRYVGKWFFTAVGSGRRGKRRKIILESRRSSSSAVTQKHKILVLSLKTTQIDANGQNVVVSITQAQLEWRLLVLHLFSS